MNEDRVLIAINATRAEAWSCWLTRRLAVALLQRAPEFLASSSDLLKRASVDVRSELVAFEREAAIANTAPAMSSTPPDLLKTGATKAALAQRLSLTKTQQGDGFRLELRDQDGDGADGMLTRAELQRVLQMLQGEVAKAGWLAAPAGSPAAPAATEPAPKPFRH